MNKDGKKSGDGTWQLVQDPPYEMWDRTVAGWWCRVVRYNKEIYGTASDEYTFFISRNGYRLDSPKFSSPKTAQRLATTSARRLGTLI